MRGFAKHTTEEDLRNSFSPYGDIREIRMIRDYAFIVSQQSPRSSIPAEQSSAQSKR